MQATTTASAAPRCNLGEFMAMTLKDLRHKRKISQEALACLSGLDRTYISLLERNQKNVTIGTLEKIIPHLASNALEFFQAFSHTMARVCQERQDGNACGLRDGSKARCPTGGNPSLPGQGRSADLSHAINNPLMVILGNVDYLMSQCRDGAMENSEQVRNRLEKAYNAAESISLKLREITSGDAGVNVSPAPKLTLE